MNSHPQDLLSGNSEQQRIETAMSSIPDHRDKSEKTFADILDMTQRKALSKRLGRISKRLAFHHNINQTPAVHVRKRISERTIMHRTWIQFYRL